MIVASVLVEEASDALALAALRLPERFGLDVEVALAEGGRLRANLFTAEEIAAGRWPVTRDLVVKTGPAGVPA